MAEKALASTLIASKQFEVREYAVPEIPPDAGLLQVEVTGVCGADIHLQEHLQGSAQILGHEIVGRIAKLGAVAARKWRMKEGDRVALEEYMPCGACDLCRTEDYRFCPQTGSSQWGQKLFYGSTSADVPPSLWGGYSQFLYLHPNAVPHRVPEHIPSAEAALFLPLSNGVEWTYRYGDLRLGDTVVIQGPGQQGLSCVIAAKEAGAGCIIVTGLGRDAHRLALAKKLGADHVIDVEKESFRQAVMDLTNGQGANQVVNVTGGGKTVVADALSVAAMHCTVVLAAAGNEQISVGGWGRKKLTMKWANGHSYQSVEQAIRLLASGKYPLNELCTHSYGLEDVGLAIRTVAGEGVAGGIHVTVFPWEGAR